MSEPDLKSIEENYANMPDWKLEQMARNDSAGIRHEVFDIIKKELEKRNLSLDLMKGVEAQNKEYNLEEIGIYSEILRNLACPICKRNSDKLNGAIVYTVKSFLLFCITKQEIIIACPSCLDRAHERATLTTILLGWWSIPHGLIKTPQYVFKNSNQKENNHNKNPTEVLRSFTLSNIGEIELNKDTEDHLQWMINNINKT